MKLIITRPLEDARPLASKLAAMGHEVTTVHLLAIVPRGQVAVPDLPYQAVVATSANAIRALRDRLRILSLPMLTVGPQSLAAAQAAGFEKAEARGGDVAGLAQYIERHRTPGAGPILYLSGSETAGDLAGRLTASGFDCVRVVLYDAVPARDLGPAETLLRSGRAEGVMLYSPRTARIWRRLLTEFELEGAARGCCHFCLSDNVAAALPPQWPRRVAASPDEQAMLALLERRAGTR
jgi:uroporphyrinogen-III synthase